MSRTVLNAKLARTGATITSRCLVADSSVRRLVGLLDRASLAEGEGLLLEPCNQIHTLFMRFPIDALFLSRDDRVLAFAEYPAWRFSRMVWKARKVLEVPVGTCRRLGVEVGDRLEFEACSS